MLTMTVQGRLEDLDRDQLLQTARRLLAEADALSSRISALNEIGIAINRTLDLNTILKVIARQAKWLLDFEHCSVCLPAEGGDVPASRPQASLEGVNDDSPGWTFTTLFGAPQTLTPEEARAILSTENVGWALRAAQPKLIREGCASPVMRDFASQIIIPLVADDIVLGTINFASSKPALYTQDDMRIAYMLSLQLASAIRNARNFSELTRARDELRTYAAQLEARNQELDAFGHTIAHDLKSPLNSIILKSELAQMRFAAEVTPEVLTYFQGIKDGGLHMNRMIDQLLWLSRLRNPKEALQPMLLRPSADAALARFTPALELGKIAVEVDDVMPRVVGHPQWLEEIFANLVSNAIKYMGADNPAPRIRIRARADGAGMVRCEVTDSGVGIAPDDQKRLFSMFTRLHTVQAEGLGLGLSIVLRIVTQLSGRVGVTSQPGQGSTFWFTLPEAAT